MTDPARIVDELVRPKRLPLACPPQSTERTKSERKAELEMLLVRCGLANFGQGAEAARILGIKRSTLFGWRNPEALDRGPTDKALEKLRRYADFLSLRCEFAEAI